MDEAKPENAPADLLRDPAIQFLSAVVKEKGDPRASILLAHGVLNYLLTASLMLGARMRSASRQILAATRIRCV